jgi:ABC-2 type transport system permease protein
VADGIRSLTLAQEVALLVRLRWRILRNRFRGKNAALELIGLIISGLFLGALVFFFAFALGEGAYFFTSRREYPWLAVLFWGVLLFWQVFAVFFSGLTASFDFHSLLRFPLRLRAFFVMNIAYGVADPVAAASVILASAILLGIAMAQGSLVPAALVVGFFFLLLNILVERCIGSLLERLFAKRRTREVFFALFFLVMISAQFTGPLLAGRQRALLPWVQRLWPYLNILPPSLAASALGAAAGGDSMLFAANVAGLAGYAMPFALLLWWRLSAQYRGELISDTESGPVVVRGAKASRASSQPAILRLLPGQVAVVVQKEFRYLLRNGMAWMNMVMPLVLVLLFALQRGPAHPLGPFAGIARAGDWFFRGAIGYVILLVTAPAYNCFAFEGRGIQTLFTAPVRFRAVLLGKNLFLIGVLAAEIAAVMALLHARGIWPALPGLLGTFAAAAYMIPAQLTVANWASLSFPRKLEFGKMRNQRAPWFTTLVTLGTTLALGASCAVVMLAGGWFGNPWLPVGVFLLLAGAAIGGYVASLDALSDLAEKKREVLIDALCR